MPRPHPQGFAGRAGGHGVLSTWRDGRGRPIHRTPHHRAFPRSFHGGLRRAGDWTFAGLRRRLTDRQRQGCACGCAPPESGHSRACEWTQVAGTAPSWARVGDDLAGGFVHVNAATHPLFELRSLTPSTTTGGTIVVTSGRDRFAVNTPKFYQADKYGPADVIAGDLHALGAGIARHPGLVQLFFPELIGTCVGTESGGARVDVPCVLLDDIDQDVLDDRARTSSAIGNLVALADTLRSTGTDLRVIFTLFHLGAGASTEWNSAEFDAIKKAPDNPPYFDPLGLRWENAHFSNTIVDGLTGATLDFGVAATDVNAWDRYTVDPANPYKREVYRRMGLAVGRAISEYADEHGLRDIIAGVEIFNEIELFHAIQGDDGKLHPDGASWGDLYYYVAAGLLEGCDWLPLWIPGIASYNDTADKVTRTWDGKEEFLDEILAQLDKVRAELPLGGRTLEMDELVAGVDYHYYHRKAGETQSLLYLPVELAALRQVLTTHGVQDAKLTVIESSVNVVCDASSPTPTTAYDAGCESDDDAWAAYDDFTDPSGATADDRPPRSTCGTGGITLPGFLVAPANDFQAASLWKRFVAAMLGGADVIGWHTHLSTNAGGFVGTGMRRDFHDADLPPSIAAARPSWFAFRRLVAILGGIRSATLLHPEPEDDWSHEFIHNQLAAGDFTTTELAWVIEFDGARLASTPPVGPSIAASWWAYMIFVDDTADGAVEPPTCAQARFMGYDVMDALADKTVYRVATGPRACLLAAGADDTFPPQAWLADAKQRADADTIDMDGLPVPTWTVASARGNWPGVILCQQRLRLLEVT